MPFPNHGNKIRQTHDVVMKFGEKKCFVLNEDQVNFIDKYFKKKYSKVIVYNFTPIRCYVC